MVPAPMLAPRADAAVAQIGQVVGLGAPADLDLLHLDEVADMGVLADVGAGPQPRIGADQGAFTDDAALQVAEGADHRAGSRPSPLDRRPR